MRNVLEFGMQALGLAFVLPMAFAGTAAATYGLRIALGRVGAVLVSLVVLAVQWRTPIVVTGWLWALVGAALAGWIFSLTWPVRRERESQVPSRGV